MREIDQALHTIREVIARELDVAPEGLDYTSSLRKDHGLDSVAAVNIVFALEEIYEVQIDLQRFADSDSLADIHQILKEHGV